MLGVAGATLRRASATGSSRWLKILTGLQTIQTDHQNTSARLISGPQLSSPIPFVCLLGSDRD